MRQSKRRYEEGEGKREGRGRGGGEGTGEKGGGGGEREGRGRGEGKKTAKSQSQLEISILVNYTRILVTSPADQGYISKAVIKAKYERRTRLTLTRLTESRKFRLSLWLKKQGCVVSYKFTKYLSSSGS